MHDFPIFETEARTILSPVSGFLAEAGFTHSLSPARNCGFGCSYCYVPSMGIYGGLTPLDVRKWGQFTTIKKNAAELLQRALRPALKIYCSPLVDPYQPAEQDAQIMPGILRAVLQSPPAIFVLQTRGSLVLRDLPLLRELGTRTCLRISFSISTNRESVRQRYEPHCSPVSERLDTVRKLVAAGIETYTTLAPLLPCDPELLLQHALNASPHSIIGDALHIRSVKARGATTRQAAVKIGEVHGESQWFEAGFQSDLISQMIEIAARAGRRFSTGPNAFRWLTREN